MNFASCLHFHLRVTYQIPLLEMPMISAPGPEDGAEASIEQTPTQRSPLGGVKTGENSLDDELPKGGNELITPTDDLLLRDPVVVRPTLDNLVKDALAERPQADRGDPGETNELVEVIAGTTGTTKYLTFLCTEVCVKLEEVNMHGKSVLGLLKMGLGVYYSRFSAA